MQPESEYDPYDDIFNMLVHVEDGRKYALNVWAFRFLERIRHIPYFESEELRGTYQLPPDLFVEKLDRPLLEKVVADLFRTEQMREEWRCRPGMADED